MDSDRKYIDLLGEDFTEWMTSPEQIALFDKMIELQSKLNKPVIECYHELVESLNLEAQIKGLPKRAFIQADPRLN